MSYPKVGIEAKRVIREYINKNFVFFSSPEKYNKWQKRTTLFCDKCKKEYSLAQSCVINVCSRYFLKNGKIDGFVPLCKNCSQHRYYSGDYIQKNEHSVYDCILGNGVEEKFKPMLGYTDKNKCGRMYYHRYLMAKKMNRCLSPFEHVHHINGNKKDNRTENLAMVDKYAHNAITQAETEVRRLRTILDTNNINY